MTVSADCCCDDIDTDGDVREKDDELGSTDAVVVDENCGRADEDDRNAGMAVAENEAGKATLCGEATAGTSDFNDVLLPLDGNDWTADAGAV